MSFAGTWIELEIIILSEIRQAQKPTVACFHSYGKSVSKIMTIIMRHECKRKGIWWGESMREREERVLGSR
jgi:hypothetical protein